VYKILITLLNRGTVILMNDYTIHIHYNDKLGLLSIYSPVRILLNRMFKLKDESVKSVSSDIKIYNQEYLLEEALMSSSENLQRLKAHYESEYLSFR
jgi:hypothetical protein